MIKQLPDSLRNDLLIESNKIVLRECQIFQNNFSEEVIKATISIIQEKYYTPYENIFTEGDENNDRSIYFVQEGVIEIYIDSTNYFNQSKKGAARQFKTIKRLKKGDFFGELEFFTDENKGMSIRSVNFSTLLKIERKEFLKIIKLYPQDYEQFCYIKDRLIMQHDFSKISQKCPSCLSDKHTLEFCPYLHLNPNKPKIFAIYNSSQYQKRNIIPKEEQYLRTRQRNRLLHEVNAEALCTYLEFNNDVIEEYVDKYLSYNISKCEVCTFFITNNSNIENNARDANSIQRHDLSFPQNGYAQSPNINISNTHFPNIFSNFSNARNKERDSQSINAQMQSSFNPMQLIEEPALQSKMNTYKKAFIRGSQSKGHIQDDYEQLECYSPKLTKPQTQNQKFRNSKRYFEHEYTKQSSNTYSPYPTSIIQQPNGISNNQIPIPNVGSYNQILSNLQPVQELEDTRSGQISPNIHRSSFSSIKAINSGFQENSQQIYHQESLKKYNRNMSAGNISERDGQGNKKNYREQIHTQLIFFDQFFGQFEKMQSFSLYYPLNNYQFVISQIHMDRDQKKQMRSQLLEQQRLKLNKIMEKKRTKIRSSRTSGLAQQSTYENKAIKRLVDKYELESKIAKSSVRQSVVVQNLLAQSTVVANNNNSNYLTNSIISHSKKNRESIINTVNTPPIIRHSRTLKTFVNNNDGQEQEGSIINNEHQKSSNELARNLLSQNGKSQPHVGGVASVNESQNFSDIININSSQPFFKCSGIEGTDNSNSMIQNLILSSNLERHKQNKKLDSSVNKFLLKELHELEKDQAIDGDSSPPQKERKVLNYEHLETPNISVFLHNRQIEEFNQHHSDRQIQKANQLNYSN